jgi:hypothetical protein
VALLLGFAATTALGAFAILRREPRAALAAFVALPLVLVTAAYPGIAAYAEQRSAKPLAALIERRSPGTEVAFVESYASGLSFYLGRISTVMSEDGLPLRSNYIAYSVRRTGVYPASIVPAERREDWLRSRTRGALLLSRHHGRGFLESVARARGAAVEPFGSDWLGVFLAAPSGP